MALTSMYNETIYILYVLKSVKSLIPPPVCASLLSLSRFHRSQKLKVSSCPSLARRREEKVDARGEKGKKSKPVEQRLCFKAYGSPKTRLSSQLKNATIQASLFYIILSSHFQL